MFILGGGSYGIYMGLEYFFKNFLITCKERDFGGRKYFLKISYLLSPLKVNWIPPLTPFLNCTIADQQTDQHTPARTNALRMKMRLNQDVGGNAKSAPVSTPCLEPILIFSHFDCDGKIRKGR